MCKMKDVNVGIKKLDFTGHRGKFFPDIKHLSVKEREGWMILDDQYFTFDRLSKVYSVKDLMTLA